MHGESAAAPSVGDRVSVLITPAAAFCENMLYRIEPKLVHGKCTERWLYQLESLHS